jgi:hypothetical protein
MNKTIDSIVLVGIIAVVFYCMMVTKDWLEDNFQIVKKEEVILDLKTSKTNPLDSYPANEGDECWIVVDGVAKYQFKYTNGQWLYWLETEEEKPAKSKSYNF